MTAMLKTTKIIDFFWTCDGEEEKVSSKLFKPEFLMNFYQNIGEIVKSFVDELEKYVDDPDKGGVSCALLSNLYFMKAAGPDPALKSQHLEKSQFYHNKVHEHNNCKGFLMLSMLRVMGTIKPGENINSVLGVPGSTSIFDAIPGFEKLDETFSLIGFGETHEVRKEKAHEFILKALEVDPITTLEFCKIDQGFFNEISNELGKHLLKQKDTIKNLETQVSTLELQLSLVPSVECERCGIETGGGSLFKVAKLDFETLSK